MGSSTGEEHSDEDIRTNCCVCGKCCCCSRSTHEYLMAGSAFTWVVSVTILQADMFTDQLSIALLGLAVFFSMVIFVVAGCGASWTRSTTPKHRPGTFKRMKILRRFIATICTIQLAMNIIHFYIFVSNLNWFQFKEGILHRELNPSDGYESRILVILATAFTAMFFQLLLSFCKESRLAIYATMLVLVLIVYMRFSAFVVGLFRPPIFLKNPEIDHSRRVILLTMTLTGQAVCGVFELAAFLNIFHLRRDWEVAPFWPDPKADFYKIMGLIQNLATRQPSTQESEGNIENTRSKLELEMNIIAPQSADTDSVEAAERNSMDELQIREHLQGEHNRMNRLRCRIIDNKNTALSLKEIIETLTDESKSKNNLENYRETLSKIAGMQEMLRGIHESVEQDEMYLEKQSKLHRVDTNIEWKLLPFDVVYLRVHSNMANILVLSGGYCLVILIFSWVNLFRVEGNHLMALEGVLNSLSKMGSDIPGAGGSIISAMITLLSTLIKLLYITVVTTVALMGIALGNNEAVSANNMLVSVLVLSCATYVSYGFLAFAAVSEKGKPRNHTVEAIGLWVGTTFFLSLALYKISAALMQRSKGLESSYDRKMDENEGIVRRLLRPKFRNATLSTSSKDYRSKLHNLMELPADAPERFRGLALPEVESEHQEGTPLQAAATAALKETTVSYMIHPCYNFETEKKDGNTILHFTTKSTCPLMYAQEIECFMIPLPNEEISDSRSNEIQNENVADKASKALKEDNGESITHSQEGSQSRDTSGIASLSDNVTDKKKQIFITAKNALIYSLSTLKHGVKVFKRSPALMAIGVILSVGITGVHMASRIDRPPFYPLMKEVDADLRTMGENIDLVVAQSALADEAMNRTQTQIDVAIDNINELDSMQRTSLDATLQSTVGVSIEEFYSALLTLSNVTEMAQDMNSNVQVYAAKAKTEYKQYYPVYHQFVKSWKGASQIGSVLGGLLILIFTAIPLFSFDKDLKVLRKQEQPSRGRILSDYLQVRNVAKIVGVQYSIASLGFYFYSMVYSLIFVVILDPNLAKVVGQLIYQNIGSVIGFIAVLVLKFYFLDGYLFEERLSKGRMIKEPRYFSMMMLIMAFYGIFTGIFTVVMRFLYAFGYTAMATCRVDLCVLPMSMAKVDQAFRCYLSTLNFFNQYTSPLFITGVSSLRDLEPASSAAERYNPMLQSEDRSNDLQKKRARARWHLAYTLVRNPVLTRDRSKDPASFSNGSGNNDIEL